MTSFLDHLIYDAGRTTAEYAADFAVLRRTQPDVSWMPKDAAELERWLAALERARQVECVDGRWEVCEDRVEAGKLF